MTAEIPEGYKPFAEVGFIRDCGPFYYLRLEDGGRRYGFLAEERHTNPYGVVHGGVLITFADTIMGRTVYNAAKRQSTTISFNTEFVAGARPGQWIEGRVELTRMTRSLAFVRGEVLAGGETLLTASGVWRLFDRDAAGKRIPPRDASAEGAG